MGSEESPRRVGRPVGPTAKGAATRRHIIDVAAREFAKIGYDKARMSGLVDATGLTKGAVYFHFENKESLAVAVLEDKHDTWIANVRTRVAAFPAGGARVAALMPAMLALHKEDPSTWAIAKLTQNLSAIDSTRALTASLTRRWVDYVAELIGEAQHSGECSSSIDRTAAAIALVGAFDGLKSIHETLTDGGDEPLMSASSFLQAMVLDQLSTYSQ